MCAKPRRSVVALAVFAGLALDPSSVFASAESWATVQAAELTRQGREHAARGEPSTATRRYLDALSFDPTFGPAYIALGAVYETSGDLREAERTYTVGIDHVAAFPDGRLARAHLFKRLRRVAEAIVDLEAASRERPDDTRILQELSGTYVATGALPAALAVTRRMAAVATQRDDAAAAGEARLQARALSRIVAEADPVANPASQGSLVRRALAALVAGKTVKAKPK